MKHLSCVSVSSAFYSGSNMKYCKETQTQICMLRNTFESSVSCLFFSIMIFSSENVHKECLIFKFNDARRQQEENLNKCH